MSMTNNNLPGNGDSTSGTTQQPAEPSVLPPAPVLSLSDKAAPHELDYPTYRAVVTAKFPDRQSGMHARQQVTSLAVENLVVQWFDSDSQDTPEDLRDESEDATALLVHLDSEEEGKDVIRICEQAGATSTKYYPARSVT